MLVLARKVGERITIGESIVITVTEFRGDKVRIGIEAPKDVLVLRTELIDCPRAEARASVPQLVQETEPEQLPQQYEYLRDDRGVIVGIQTRE